jgi:pilus assembly protein Flp/PilA
MLRKFLKDESGATAIEYGLIAALVAVACIVALTRVGGSLKGLFETVDSKNKTASRSKCRAGTVSRQIRT